jgi:AmmeMemoRadiSam system protein B/AmmeMemoRadiSam system protein A
MYWKSIAILLSIMVMYGSKVNAQPQPKVRPMAVAGQFYPSDKSELTRDLGNYFQKYSSPASHSVDSIAAVIVPHAGYVFSAEVAAKAFSLIPKDAVYEHIFLIGPSHHTYFEGASVNYAFDYYQTPLGNIKVDTALGKELDKENACFTYKADAHAQEHCLEVQLPFLQYHLSELPPIVPIIIGTQKFSVIKQIAEALKPYFNSRNLFVISSDFSHYPSYEDAIKVDGNTGQAIETGDLTKFAQALKENYDGGYRNLATSACGQSAIATLMLLTGGDSSYSYKDLLYKNSGDSVYGGKDEVVGYHAFLITRKSAKNATEDFTLTAEEKKTLLEIARSSIQDSFTHKDLSSSWEGRNLTETLKMKCGAFVTLNESGHLRGCVGHFGENIPLYEVVADMARAAAFEDTRFNEVSQSELSSIEIEISVLSPLKKIDNISQFQYGKQGIYICKDSRGGTFLPQVAQEVNWTKEEFLGHCSRDKAGLGWDGWKNADLYTYEAVIFKEGE